jgi:prepilin-type N-terminal cleavage/methylation domain-containing protein
MTAARRTRANGFTLIELLVAVAAGLFVIVAAFLMAKGATRLFASESRIATAQLNVRNAMDRLRTDLQRASFQSSANAKADPFVCPPPTSTWAVQGIRHVDKGSETDTNATAAVKAMWTANNLHPDSIYVQGNFLTTDVYPAAAIDQTSVTLSQSDPAVQRLLQLSGGGETGLAAALTTVFPANRLLRITNEFGRSQYMVVASGASVTGTTSVTIPLATTPSLQTSATSNDPQCGVIGNGTRSTVNPVQTFRYWVGSLAGLDANYAWAYPDGGPGDDAKSDLLRQEIDTTSGLAIGTVEIVAENIVDLDFAFNVDATAIPTIGGAAYAGPTAILAYDYADTVGMAYAAAVTSPGTPTGPHRIRSVRIRVAGRNRELDRQSGVDDGGPNLLRIGIAVGATTMYARTRTLQEEVLLTNQWGLSW